MQQFYELSKLCSHFEFGEITKKNKNSFQNFMKRLIVGKYFAKTSTENSSCCKMKKKKKKESNHKPMTCR